MQLPRFVRRLVIPAQVRRSLDQQVQREHPTEAGGYLDCRRAGNRLVATGHVPVDNDAADPTRRFETTVDERAPAFPRVFYHSHTSAASPAGMTNVDRKRIPEQHSLVLFAPDSEVYSYRCFKRGLARWHELPVCGQRLDATTYPLPRLR